MLHKLLFILFSILGIADFLSASAPFKWKKEAFDYETYMSEHHAIPLANLEGEPSAFVNHVNVITGDFNLTKTDFVTPGNHPLSLDRSYTSSDDRSTDDKHGALCEAWHFNLWHEIYLDGYKERKKGFFFPGDPVFHCYATVRSGGSQILFKSHSKHSDSFHPLIPHFQTLRKGLTNTASGKSGKTNIKNTTIEWKHPYLILRKGSGAIQWHKFQKNIYPDDFFLEKEETPSGVNILYEYPFDDRWSVRTENKTGTLLNKLNFKRPYKMKTDSVIEVNAYDGRSVFYSFEKKEKKRFFLTKVVSPQFPEESYGYDENADLIQLTLIKRP